MSKERRRVRRAFDPKALARICEMHAEDFSLYATRVDLPPTTDRIWVPALATPATPPANSKTISLPRGTAQPKGAFVSREKPAFYFYKDNGSDILAVAHLDSVQAGLDGAACRVSRTENAGSIAFAGNLDDRLGAFIILEMLPALDISCDWLLTINEETAQTTAADFTPPPGKSYNWVIECDRGGTDVVMYEYDTPALRKLVKASGAHVAIGSYSDICALDHLGVAGFNWGVGYADYHGPRAHAWLSDTLDMLARFVRFHRENAGTVFVHEPRVTAYRGFGNISNLPDWWFDEEPDDRTSRVSAASYMGRTDPEMCDGCAEKLIAGFCPECGRDYADGAEGTEEGRLAQWFSS